MIFREVNLLFMYFFTSGRTDVVHCMYSPAKFFNLLKGVLTYWKLREKSTKTVENWHKIKVNLDIIFNRVFCFNQIFNYFFLKLLTFRDIYERTVFSAEISP